MRLYGVGAWIPDRMDAGQIQTENGAYCTEQGELQEIRKKTTVKKGADEMLRKYPKYVAIFERTAGKHKGNRETKRL